MESPSQTSQAQLCRNGCGFYGSSKNDGMCSMCYKDSIQKKNNSGRKSPNSVAVTTKDKLSSSVISDGSVATAMASLATTDKAEEESTLACNVSASSLNTTTASTSAVPSATDPSTGLTTPTQVSNENEANSSLEVETPSPSKPKKNRCASCRKRLGLTGFYCRCGNTYCGLHRYSDQHACQFDYKADAQAKIRKENPVVVGEKINKI